jgi:hypothetical protein
MVRRLALKYNIIFYVISSGVYKKGKAFPLQAWTGPWGFQEFEAPEFLDNWHMKVVRLSALRTGRLYPRKDSWYSFLLEAELNPGPQCDRKD